MKICVIADIHARRVWSTIVQRECNRVDRFIFLGDYFDASDKGVSAEEEVQNFRDILGFAEDFGAVDLLIGNHDLHYAGGAICSGYRSEVQTLLGNTLEGLIASGRLCCTARWGDYLFVHAGISTVWMQLRQYTELEQINRCFRQDALSIDYSPYAQHFGDYGGDSIYQSPIWIRPASLADCAWRGCHQIVGHTPMQEICYLPMGEHRIIFCDTDLCSYLLIDTERGQEDICILD